LQKLVIRDGTLIDGTGQPGFKGDVVIDEGRITHIGQATNYSNEVLQWDATGKIVCPGFIDIHSHADFPLYVDGFAQSGVRQGVTTAVIGNCGHGPAPAHSKELTKIITIGYNDDWGIDFNWSTFDEYLNSLLHRGQSINVAPLVAHGAIRLSVMGFDARKPSRRELENMKSLARESMSQGAMGISTGLEYSPGQHADEAELVALATVVSAHGGVYASHIRERGDEFERSVNEALNIGFGADIPLQLSHLAPRPYAPPGAFKRVLEMIERGRDRGLQIGIDTFPDSWGPAHLTDLLPPWVHEGSKEEVVERLHDPKTAMMCADYVENQTNFLLRLGGFDYFYLSNSKRWADLVGCHLEEISKKWGLSHTETILKLAASDGVDYSGVMIRHIFASQSSLDKLLSDPHCSVGSDGAFTSLDGILGNLIINRSSFGYAPRFIREYALDRGMFTMEEAIRKLTSLPADSVQIRDRGRLIPGMAADLVVFDQDDLTDNSTDDAPQAYPSGIELVVVNGESVFMDGAHTQKIPGRVLKL
jgi:N-acyl-D-aspartate/D-glutamate deacylase